LEDALIGAKTWNDWKENIKNLYDNTKKFTAYNISLDDANPSPKILVEATMPEFSTDKQMVWWA
jgi:hypothetical protein